MLCFGIGHGHIFNSLRCFERTKIKKEIVGGAPVEKMKRYQSIYFPLNFPLNLRHLLPRKYQKEPRKIFSTAFHILIETSPMI